MGREPVKNGAGRPTVLFMAGSGRSGSTILHNVLCQISGVVAVGEVRYIWDRGFKRDQLCGCGDSFRSCAFWQDVASAAFGGMDRVPHERLAELTEGFRIKDLPVAGAKGARARRLQAIGELTDALSRLYRAIAEVGRSDVVVDSSKHPASGFAAKSVPEVAFKALHIVRDAPAVAYSWSTHRASQPGMALRRQTPVAAALQWNARNSASEVYLRGSYRRLRYEDFAADPEGELTALAGWIGHGDDPLPVEGNRVVISQPNHSVYGNEVRLVRGEVVIRRDDRWRSAMAEPDRRRVASLTFPLRLRYGYLAGQLRPVGRVAP